MKRTLVIRVYRDGRLMTWIEWDNRLLNSICFDPLDGVSAWPTVLKLIRHRIEDHPADWTIKVRYQGKIDYPTHHEADSL